MLIKIFIEALHGKTIDAYDSIRFSRTSSRLEAISWERNSFIKIEYLRMSKSVFLKKNETEIRVLLREDSHNRRTQQRKVNLQ